MFGGSNANAYILIYRQRKVSKETEAKGSVPIPPYWLSEMERVNNAELLLRQNYDKLKNQFDIVIQDVSTYFDVQETNFVSYLSMDKILEQGTTLRLEFTDAVSAIKFKVYKHL